MVAMSVLDVNSHLVHNRLKIDVTPIIACAGYTHLLARATVAQRVREAALRQSCPSQLT